MDTEVIFIVSVFEGTMSKTKRILVVDDDDRTGSLLCRYLGECSFEVHSAGDGTDAVELLKENEGHFDIVITDYFMPQMNGLELTRHVREWYPRTLIIGMSGFDAVRNDFLTAGAHAFVRKPFRLPDILGAINSVHPQ